MATTTVTAITGRLFEALRVYNVEVLSKVHWRFYGSTDLRVLSTDLRGFLFTVRFGSVDLRWFYSTDFDAELKN